MKASSSKYRTTESAQHESSQTNVCHLRKHSHAGEHLNKPKAVTDLKNQSGCEKAGKDSERVLAFKFVVLMVHGMWSKIRMLSIPRVLFIKLYLTQCGPGGSL
jgi:hypothetical protein